MAVSYLTALDGHTVDLQDVINALDDELGPMPQDALCEAIRLGNEDAMRGHRYTLEGPLTIAHKRLAIQTGRPELLKSLLEQDDLITEDLVSAACTAKDRAYVRVPLDFGWPVNKAVGFDASML